jgi:hypothetical protein
VTAPEILEAAAKLGVGFRVISGNRLVAEPASRLIDELRAEIRAHKTEIVDYLLEQAPTELPEPTKRGRYVPNAPTPTVCSWCAEPVTTPPGTLPLARRTASGDLLHAACWTASTRAPGGHQPKTPGLDAAIKRADAEKERA